METPLSARLRHGTQESHRLAENTPFIRDFFKGNLSLASYREFLVQLYSIYSALEKSQELHRSHRIYSLLYFPALYRTAALERDLDFFYGDAAWRDVQPLAATEEYVQRILMLSQTWVEGLVAHHYTRYLGDLSGGQVLKRVVAKTFDLPSGQGQAFYEFPHIADHKAFKEEYRARLDGLALDDNTAQEVVNEAIFAFELNRRVFYAMLEPANLTPPQP